MNQKDVDASRIPENCRRQEGFFFFLNPLYTVFIKTF